MTVHHHLLTLPIAFSLLSGCTPSPSSYDTCHMVTRDQAWQEFTHPSDSTRTKVWWFHGETESTRQGVTLDLEAFRQAGVGGVVYYDQRHGVGDRACEAFSPEWWDNLKFTASEAARLGLTWESHLSNGFVGGGPWITPQLGMKFLTATDTLLQGGQWVDAELPNPTVDWYEQVAVVALPVKVAPLTQQPSYSTNLPQTDASLFFLPQGPRQRLEVPTDGKPVLINFDYPAPVTLRSLTYWTAPRGRSVNGRLTYPCQPGPEFVGYGYAPLPPIGTLQVSDDGLAWRDICALPGLYSDGQNTCQQQTVSFPAICAAHFRLNLHDWAQPTEPQRPLMLHRIVPHAEPLMNQWENLSGLRAHYEQPDATPEYPADEVYAPDEVILLTAEQAADGHLHWQAPEGQWRVLRFCQVSTRAHIKHARRGIEGLECDKLSAQAAAYQWQHYFGPILDTLRLQGLPVDGLVVDSHEASTQNWTQGFEYEFLVRRGYDLMSWLPALQGYIIGSRQATYDFLHDMRRTIADVCSDRYVGTLDSLCLASGLRLTAQALGGGQSMLSDNIQAKGRATKPEGEFWAYQQNGSYDIKEAVSAAHLYGHTVASAEAFTDFSYAQPLSQLKHISDISYAMGINEYVVCASAYQPWGPDTIPGSTGGGRHYCLNRNNTYWPYSRPFWDYQARSAAMQRHGRPVVDCLIYLGDEVPVKIMPHRFPELPAGFDFDVCTTDALLDRIEARNGQMVLPDGMQYSMLFIQRQAHLTPAAQQKIEALRRAGIPVYTAEDTCQPNLLPDLEGAISWTAPASLPGQPMLRFSHRAWADADCYFVCNPGEAAYCDQVTMRSGYRFAEFWDPLTGRRHALDAQSMADGRLSVSLYLHPDECGFIVASDTPCPEPVSPFGKQDEAREILGDWTVCFDARWGGPAQPVVFDSLYDWTLSSDPAIRYYSGAATYSKPFVLTAEEAQRPVRIELPQVQSLAVVSINGIVADTLWCSPWTTDLTPYIHEGENLLEIKVVNSLYNRMIGDSSLPESQRYTFAYPAIVTPQTPLVSSGLLAPVRLCFGQ